MAANYLHGAETIEITKGARPISVVKSAVIGLVGIAPQGPTQTPTLVLNPGEAAQFGSRVPGFNIPRALEHIFAQGSATVIVINVFEPNDHTTAVTDEALTIDANNKTKLAFAPVKKDPENDPFAVLKKGEDTLVQGTDYEIDAFGNITILGTVLESDEFTASYFHLNEVAVVAADIIGAIDGTTDERTGMKAFDLCFSMFGFNAKLFIAPDYSTLSGVASELAVVSAKFRGHHILDAPEGTTPQNAIVGRGPAGTINFNTSNERALLCYPMLKAYDPYYDANVNVPYSEFLAGLIAATDNTDGYWFSSSNREIKGIVGVERMLTSSVNDPQTQTNLLNEKGIITVFNGFGTGIRSWGNRSAAFPTNTNPKNFYCVRRTADVIHESLELAMLQFIDLPINDAIIDSIKESGNAFMRTLKQRGAVIDGKVLYNPDKNPATELAAGHLLFDVEFMPPTPAERITFESFIDISLLNQLGQE